MNKLISISFSLLLPLLFTGCIKDNYSKCPSDSESNVILHFQCSESDALITQFTDYISSVDLMIYNQQGELCKQKTVDSKALNEFQGVSLSLSPGAYKVVSWANVDEGIQIEDENSTNNPYITYSSIDSDKRVLSIDSVYYAQEVNARNFSIPNALELVVPRAGPLEQNLFFRPAHRQLSIYIKGYTENSQSVLPNIGIEGLPAALHLFDMNPIIKLGEVEALQKTKEVLISNESYAATQVTSFWFEIDHTIKINIYSPLTGELIYTIPLHEALEIAKARGASYNRKLEIFIGFIQGEIEINVPDWNSGDVNWS